MIWSFIFLISILPIISSSCPNTKKCLHNGMLNRKTCECECYSAYVGEFCEIGDCKNQPLLCQTDFGPKDCSQPSIANICPLMCQQPICKCGFDSCLNGGFFNEKTCLCECPEHYTGNRCDIFKKTFISTLQTTTLTSNFHLPDSTSFLSRCPKKLACLNGAQQNHITCQCECKDK